MAQFQPAFEFLMTHEDPGMTGVVTVDSGGKTKYGISQKAFPELDIANLSIEQAANIYRNNYWFPIDGPEIQSQLIANKLLDMAVNMGVRAATMLCQKACGDAGYPTTADGRFGTLTLLSVNECDEVTLLDALRSRSKDHYCQIAVANPDEAKYLNGWLKRAEV
jgi:lysozyme family protein